MVQKLCPLNTTWIFALLLISGIGFPGRRPALEPGPSIPQRSACGGASSGSRDLCADES